MPISCRSQYLSFHLENHDHMLLVKYVVIVDMYLLFIQNIVRRTCDKKGNRITYFHTIIVEQVTHNVLETTPENSTERFHWVHENLLRRFRFGSQGRRGCRKISSMTSNLLDTTLATPGREGRLTFPGSQFFLVYFRAGCVGFVRCTLVNLVGSSTSICVAGWGPDGTVNSWSKRSLRPQRWTVAVDHFL